MGLADPDAALEQKKLRALLVRDEHAQWSDGSRTTHVARTRLQPLIESIARYLDPDRVLYGHHDQDSQESTARRRATRALPRGSSIEEGVDRLA